MTRLRTALYLLALVVAAFALPGLPWWWVLPAVVLTAVLAGLAAWVIRPGQDSTDNDGGPR